MIFRILKAAFLATFFLFSNLSFAGAGSGDPNPVGGFGQAPTSGTAAPSPNPVGGFGSNADMPLNDPPPPPPDPVPLDGGVSLLIAAALGLGVKKLYGEIKSK